MALCCSLLFATLVIFTALACRSTEGGWTPTEEEDVKLQVQLKKLNKPAIKTIQSMISGELFNCVDIYKQPAFDNPLLKDHKLQLRPSRSSKRLQKKSSFRAELGAARLGYNDSCPTGTVLIRRATEEDLKASKRIPNRFTRIYGTKENQGGEVDHYALLIAENSTGFTGFRTNLTTWEIPSVDGAQYSAAEAWIIGELDASANAIEAGWHVYPSMYGRDTRPRFFTHWTSDNYRTTGCFNLLCSGFVQISKEFGPGSLIQEVSHSNAIEKNIRITMYKDAETKNWWLDVDNVDIGYWPMDLFNKLELGKVIEFGGQVGSLPSLKSPPMGNGNFPGFGSAYFRNVLFAGVEGSFYVPNNKDLRFDVDLPDYYKILKDSATDAYFNIAFGGPGGYKSG